VANTPQPQNPAFQLGALKRVAWMEYKRQDARVQGALIRHFPFQICMNAGIAEAEEAELIYTAQVFLLR